MPPTEKKKFSLEGIVMQYGIAKDAQSAQKVLIGIAVVAIIGTLYLWMSGGKGTPAQPLPSGEPLPEELVN